MRAHIYPILTLVLSLTVVGPIHVPAGAAMADTRRPGNPFLIGPLSPPAWFGQGDQSLASFGGSVAGAGDVNGDGFEDVVVGAILYDNGLSDEGRAYLYLGSAVGLSAQPAWAWRGQPLRCLVWRLGGRRRGRERRRLR